MARKRANWQQPLPRTLVIPGIMKLKTLADVRELFRHLPADRKERSTWQVVARTVALAALGATSMADVEAALWLIFQLEGGECRPE
jgi:hypothetical protein